MSCHIIAKLRTKWSFEDQLASFTRLQFLHSLGGTIWKHAPNAEIRLLHHLYHLCLTHKLQQGRPRIAHHSLFRFRRGWWHVQFVLIFCCITVLGRSEPGGAHNATHNSQILSFTSILSRTCESSEELNVNRGPHCDRICHRQAFSSSCAFNRFGRQSAGAQTATLQHHFALTEMCSQKHKQKLGGLLKLLIWLGSAFNLARS